MTIVPLKALKPNPWRDFNSCPLDEDHIESLQRSIKAHGFVGGLKVRPNGNGYQLAFGHSRLEAAKRAKIREVDVIVADMDDDEMVGLMIDENATQSGSKAAVIFNEVKATVQRLVKILHGHDNFSLIQEKLPRSLFDSDRVFDSARGRLLHGEGVGEPLVRRYLGHGNEDHCPRTKVQIQEALATLKQSGKYDEILREVGIITQEEDEEEEQTAGNRLESSDTPPRRARVSDRQRHPQIFDERCVQVFPIESHSNAFRIAITTESARRFIRVDQQLKVAKQLVRDMRRIGGDDPNDTRGTGRRGAVFVKSYVSGIVQQAITGQRQIDREERQRLMREQRLVEVQAQIDYVMMHMRSMAGGFVKLKSTLERQPELWENPRINTLSLKAEAAISALRNFRATASRRNG